MDIITCRHCDRRIVQEDGAWIDPEAPATPEDGDDFIWRETCDQHDTFIADHEPPDDVPPCDHVGTSRIQKFDGGRLPLLCGRCYTIVERVSP